MNLFLILIYINFYNNLNFYRNKLERIKKNNFFIMMLVFQNQFCFDCLIIRYYLTDPKHQNVNCSILIIFIQLRYY